MQKILASGRLGLLTLAVTLAAPSSAQRHQPFDPRPTLGFLIQGFQMCGPPAAYFSLSPAVWNIVAQQTGGTGCYQSIAMAGPITRMDVIETRPFPIGPLYVIRVTHAGSPASVVGPVDWFVGFNQMTGKIEYISFQNVVPGERPSIEEGPDPTKNLGGAAPVSDPRPTPTPPQPNEDPRLTALERSCAKFAIMCP